MLANPRLLLIYAIVLLDVIVGAAAGPVMPQFVQGLTEPQLWLTLGTALFLGIQLVSAPLLGLLSDQVGRRPVVLISAFGTLAANAFLLPVRTGLFFLNRVSDGFTNGLYALMHSAVADVSELQEVVKTTGLVSTVQALGSIVGPLVAGAVLWLGPPAGQQTRWVILAVLLLSSLNVGLSCFFRETAPATPGLDAPALRAEVVRSLHVPQLWQRLQQLDTARPGLASVTLLTLLLTLNQGYLNYFLPYIGLGQLHLSVPQLASFFAFFGGLSAVSNFLYFEYLVDRLDKRWVLIGASWTGVALHLVYANIHGSLPLLYVAAAADALSASLIAGLLNGLLAQLSEPETRGELFGITQALTGLASLVTTLVYGALSLLALNAPFYWFAACMATLAGLAMRLRVPLGESPVATRPPQTQPAAS